MSARSCSWKFVQRKAPHASVAGLSLQRSADASCEVQRAVICRGCVATAEFHSVHWSVGVGLRHQVERGDICVRLEGYVEENVIDAKQHRQRGESCCDKPARRTESVTGRPVMASTQSSLTCFNGLGVPSYKSTYERGGLATPCRFGVQNIHHACSLESSI